MSHVLNEVRENPGVAALAAVGAAEGAYKYYLRDHLTPKVGWAALAGLVVAYDLLAPKTLSRSFHEANQRHPILTTLAVAELAAHLLAPRYDPVTIAYDRFK